MQSRGNFIRGSWAVVAQPEGEIVRENPCRLDEVVFRAPWSAASVDDAVGAAREALPAWDRLGVEGRRPYLERFKAILTERREELARAIATETGKPLWEARGEATALTAKIDIMSGEGLGYTAEVQPAGSGGLFRYRPLGVLAVIGPFNFPLHLPNGHIVPGLLTGNTIVVKPSELTAGSMQLYFECAEAAGFPPGVLNLVQGPGPVGAALTGHEGIHGVLFTGSYSTGLKIKQATLDQYWKLLALEMGGKNTSIVLEDANLEQAVYEIVQAAFLTTGQRCSATSRVVLRREVAERFTEAFVAAAARVTMGDALDEECFMGPLVNRAGYDTFLRAQGDDDGGTLERLLEGGPARDDLNGYFVRPAVWRARRNDPTGTHHSHEIFGPDVVLYTVDSDEEAAAVANATEFGLAMSVFTADEARFDRLAYDLHTGILNMNRSTVGASSRLPFGGVKKSGNHRPSAVLAGQYCTYPQAQLRLDAGFSAEALTTGPLRLLK